ncbi:hypothetical protein [Clostridium beijerinckii]|uniref:Uncharacterized protein n=1 Tax=Clostridium beijerinckii TaxID=1520 RepID=A0AAW3W714_CLOBE|nr:hypothetical protein [Clostridium beijerinckii]MBC2455910.1 hypothetical protein [Clostridium beijerinckii]MBC2474715.1 hypothetical protein [Clostridium beijerinckii]MDG5852867.1 hypothetical protein [Clostridium beijerinckii]NOV61865.1 hypothetical protein [Clostridium beijerinckii]NOV68639.1 hypothetical protein [Clostridium beijerinckii]
MEFKLNKIDTDIRKKIQEEIKENKVHSGKAINVKRELEDEEKTKDENHLLQHNNDKKYITIDGMRHTNESLEIKVEKMERINEENSKGRILDAKK